MDEWNEEFLSYEVEKELEKHRTEREGLDNTQSASSSGLGCGRILFGVALGIVGLVIIVLFFL